jgi:hypothetical protein
MASYPNSSFAIGFIEILKKMLQKPWSSQISLIEQFNSEIKKVFGVGSLDLWTISGLFSYVKKSASIWSENQSKYRYYLYSDSCDSDVVGILELVRISQEKYKIALFYQDKSWPIIYKNSRFFIPNLLFLQATFIPESFLSNPFLSSRSIPVLVGEIQGKKILGIPTMESSWCALQCPSLFLQWTQLLQQRIAILYCMDILIQTVMFMYNSLHKNTIPFFMQKKIYENSKYFLNDLYQKSQKYTPVRIPELNKVEEEILRQKVQLAILLAKQEGLAQKDFLEEQATQLEYIKKKMPIKEKRTEVLFSSLSEMIHLISHAFQTNNCSKIDFCVHDVQYAMQKNQKIMENVYQGLSNIYATLIATCVEKKVS